MSGKSAVYSWRVSAATKARLEDAAREQRRSVAQLLEDLVADGLARGRSGELEAARQRRLHTRATRFAGRIAGADPTRSVNVRTLVRARLRRSRP